MAGSGEREPLSQLRPWHLTPVVESVATQPLLAILVCLSDAVRLDSRCSRCVLAEMEVLTAAEHAAEAWQAVESVNHSASCNRGT